MSKTRVLLAFGSHGIQESRVPGDQRFFRKAVIPFIEDTVKNGKPIALIYETVLGLDNRIKTPVLDKISKGSGERWLSEIKERVLTEERHINECLDTVFVSGNPELYTRASAKCLAGGGILEGIVDWGFEDFILELNSAGHSNITALIEPQSSEVSLGIWRREELNRRIESLIQGPENELLNAITDYIKFETEFQLSRDKGIKFLVDGLIKEKDVAAVCIPRGGQHRGMASLFNHDGYDVTVHDSGVPSDFIYEAVNRSYRERIPEEELVLYARLQMEFLRYKGKDFLLALVETFMQNESPEFTFHEVKREIIQKNPEIAQKLRLQVC